MRTPTNNPRENNGNNTEQTAELPWRAFQACEALTQLTLPNNLTQEPNLTIEIQEALNFLCTPDPINSPLEDLSHFSSTIAPSNTVMVGSETYRAARDEMLALILPDALSDQNQYRNDLFAIAERYKTAPITNPDAAEAPSLSQ